MTSDKISIHFLFLLFLIIANFTIGENISVNITSLIVKFKTTIYVYMRQRVYLKLKIELELFSVLNYVQHKGDVAYFMTELFWNDPKDKDYWFRFPVSSRMPNTCRIFCRTCDLSREIENESLKIVTEEQWKSVAKNELKEQTRVKERWMESKSRMKIDDGPEIKFEFYV